MGTELIYFIMANSDLTNAKRAKNDEFYTQYGDIEEEISAYIEYDANAFRGKVVYCNCDDPYESNFFRYFVLNFQTLGLKKLITTSYKPSPVANTQLGLFGDDRPLPFMNMADNKKFNKQIQKNENSYQKYDNYDAIEVPCTNAIPSDYDGVMGVPISFLDKYSPEQFEIIGGTANGQVPDEFKAGSFNVYNNPISNEKKIYQRILIKHKGK